MGREPISWGVDLAAADAADVILDDCAACDIGLLVSDAGFEFKRTHERNDASAMSKMLMVHCRAPSSLRVASYPGLLNASVAVSF